MESKDTILQMFKLYEDEILEVTDIHNKIIKKKLEILQPFYENLTKEQKEEFEKIENIESERVDEVYKNIFIYGYSLANRLLVESLKDK